MVARPRQLVHKPGVVETPGFVVLRFPFTEPLITPNKRVHPLAKNRAIQMMRAESKRLALMGKVQPIAECRVIARWLVGDKRRRDGGAAFLFGKAAVDGLVDAGVLADDHYGIVTRESQEIVPAEGWGLELEIEVTA